MAGMFATISSYLPGTKPAPGAVGSTWVGKGGYSYNRQADGSVRVIGTPANATNLMNVIYRPGSKQYDAILTEAARMSGVSTAISTAVATVAPSPAASTFVPSSTADQAAGLPGAPEPGITDHPYFWPGVGLSVVGVAAAAILFWPKGKK